jgi:hypothetical protein
MARKNERKYEEYVHLFDRLGDYVKFHHRN